jgi:hypothetical protein
VTRPVRLAFLAGVILGATLTFAAGHALASAPRPSLDDIPTALSPVAGESDLRARTGASSPGSGVAQSAEHRYAGSAESEVAGAEPVIGSGGGAPASESASKHSEAGIASWYADPAKRGLYAAAGPGLRVGHWRGRVVTVCRGAVCLDVRLSDYCGCLRGTPRERLVDLSPDAFSRLASLSRGLVRVTVRY